MTGCVNRANGECILFSNEWAESHCYIKNENECPYHKPVSFTNADKIRAMNDIELARLLASNADCNECRIYSYKDGCMESYDTCVCQWLDWLNQEAPDD